MEGTIGEIRMFAGNFAPRDWAFCHGQSLRIGDHQALYSVIGDYYGGNGRTDFALPDFRGRVAVGAGIAPGLSNYQLSQTGGVEEVKLSLDQIPSHSHAAAVNIQGGSSIDITAKLHASKKEGTRSVPNSGDYLAAGKEAGFNSIKPYVDPSPNDKVELGGLEVSASGAIQIDGITIGNSGRDQGHENRQPYLAIHYIICLEGQYPARY